MSHVAGLKGSVERRELTRAERAVGRRAAEIRATVPHLELSIRARLGGGVEAGTGGSPRPSLAALAVAACGRALREVPLANGSARGDWVELYSRVNVGVTASAEAVYLLPTIFDADQKAPAQIDAELVELRRRALAGELLAPEMAGSTFSVWDAGEEGLHSAGPLVLATHAAALTIGAPELVPLAEEGGVGYAAMTMLTLACDHRILYGAVAGGFLRSIRNHLEQASK